MKSIRPSSADTWMLCNGQPAFVEQLSIPDNPSWYASEGTVAHHVGALCLEGGCDASRFEGYNAAVNQKTGKLIAWGDTYGGDDYEISEQLGDQPHWLYEVDAEMINNVQEYVDYVRRESYGHSMMIEKPVDVSGVLAIKDRTGTADTIILPADATPLTFVDLKYGKGVAVNAKGNRQLRIYAAGFIEEYEDILGPWDSVRLVIHQPRLNSVSEWVVPVDRLKKFARLARKTSKFCQQVGEDYEEHLNPGEKQCKFCDAKPYCPKLADMVEEVLDEDLDIVTGGVVPFNDRAKLGERRKLVELLESWAKSVRNLAQSELEAGGEVPGFKLVIGRKGDRCWSDPAKAEKQLKKFRLRNDQMYSQKLITPTQAEKLITKPRYEKLQDMGMIDQPDGKPTVAPESDPRETVVIDPMFDNLD